jgi:hypothetical protein
MDEIEIGVHRERLVDGTAGLPQLIPSNVRNLEPFSPEADNSSGKKTQAFATG